MKNKVIGKGPKMFNQLLNMNLAVEVIMIILGFVMFFNPAMSNKAIGIVVGVILLLSASSLIYNYISRDGAKIYSLNLIFGLLVGLLGLVLIVYPYSLIDFVINCIGIYMIINGAVKINHGLWLRKGKEESWLIVVSSGILLIFISLVFIFSTFVSLTITRVIGIFLIISGALSLMDTILFKKRSKEIVKIFW